jgi:hypothetical protein
MSWIIAVGVFLLGVIAVMALSAPANATDREHQKPPVAAPSPTTSLPIAKKKDHRWQVPVLVIGVAGVVCWFYCDKKEPEPLPDFGPAVKNDVTPDNLKDKPRKFIVEAY